MTKKQRKPYSYTNIYETSRKDRMMTDLGVRIFRWLTDWGISSNSAKGRELWKLSDEATTLEALNAELLEALTTCVLQIEYLHEKFQETGSGNAAIAQAVATRAKARGES